MGHEIDFLRDGIVLGGTHLQRPIEVADLAALLDDEPTRQDHGELTLWEWASGIGAFVAESDTTVVSVGAEVDVCERVLVDGRPYEQVFADHDVRDFADGTIEVLPHEEDPARLGQPQWIVVSYVRKHKPAGPPPPVHIPDVVGFNDLNFKLAVVQELMYRSEVLEPKFDLHTFIARDDVRDVDIELEGRDPIPEALLHFAELEVPSELLASIDQIHMDGGNQVYMQIAPRWHGEDASFDLGDLSDLDKLPNLTRATVIAPRAVVEQLQARGIDARHV